MSDQTSSNWKLKPETTLPRMFSVSDFVNSMAFSQNSKVLITQDGFSIHDQSTRPGIRIWNTMKWDLREVLDVPSRTMPEWQRPVASQLLLTV